MVRLKDWFFVLPVEARHHLYWNFIRQLIERPIKGISTPGLRRMIEYMRRAIAPVPRHSRVYLEYFFGEKGKKLWEYLNIERNAKASEIRIYQEQIHRALSKYKIEDRDYMTQILEGVRKIHNGDMTVDEFLEIMDQMFPDIKNREIVMDALEYIMGSQGEIFEIIEGERNPSSKNLLMYFHRTYMKQN